ncbi:hypothetical protein AK88_03773 [Plasmodium fragile]|uniref:Merozoite surface protein 3 n=1 Tax=Plasmodium fragile TaxID=5857 RepID=A0A0D9QIH7_PLAFR|nr:uncharacterized protein AK88_03773 [Plasmodium fragile]KJP86577.1 hypothetical protein AK88_03773 [Plasmodium fragile]
MKSINHISFFFIILLILTRENKLASGKFTSHTLGNLTTGLVDNDKARREKDMKECERGNGGVEVEGDSPRKGELDTHVGRDETEEGTLDERGDTVLVQIEEHEESVNSVSESASGGDGELGDDEVEDHEVEDDEADDDEADEDEDEDDDDEDDDEVDDDEADDDEADDDEVDDDEADDDEEVDHEQIDFEQVEDAAREELNWDETNESEQTEAESTECARPYHHKKYETNDEAQRNIDTDEVKMEIRKWSGGHPWGQNNIMLMNTNHMEEANEEGQQVGSVYEQEDGAEGKSSVSTSDTKANDLLMGDYKQANEIKKAASALVDTMINMLEEHGEHDEVRTLAQYFIKIFTTDLNTHKKEPWCNR